MFGQTSVRSIEDVKNKNVLRWDYTPAGNLTPKTVGIEEELFYSLRANPKRLLPLLDDSDRFIAAHILLFSCNHSQLEFQDPKASNYFLLSNHSWGPLEVCVHKDGTFTIDPTQKQKISKYWHDIFMHNRVPVTD